MNLFKSPLSRMALGLAMLLALFGGAMNSSAAVKTWNVSLSGGTANGTWTTVTAWSPTGLPANSDSAVFSSSITAATTVALSTATKIADISFTAGTGGWVVSGNTFSVTGTTTVGASQNATYSVAYLNSGVNLLTGGGALDLAITATGGSSSGYGGHAPMNINYGSVQLDGASLAGAFTYYFPVTLGDAGNHNAKLILGSTAGTVSAVVSGLSTVGSGTCSIVGGNSAASTLMILNTTSGTTITYGGNLGGGGANENNLSLAMSGTPITLTLTGNNTYTGGTTVGGKGGSLKVGSATALPAAQSVTCTGTGTLDLNGNSVDIGSLTMSGSGIIDNSSSTAATMTFGEGNATCDLGSDNKGEIIKNTGAAGGLSLVKTGTGTATIYSAETYSGNTKILGGKLALSGAGSIVSTPTITVAASATFDVSATTAATTLASGQALAFSGSGAAGTIVTTTSKGLSTAANSPLAFTAYNGTAPVTVSGAGGLTLATGNPVTVNVAHGGTALGQGTYTLISAGVLGSSPTSLTVTGDGFTSGTTKTLAITGGALQLTVQIPPSAYTITGSGTMSAGGSQTVTITALDSTGATLTSLAGAINLTFSGLSSSPNSTAPTVAGTAFGTGTSVTFSSGVAMVTLAAYDAQSSTVACTDGTASTSSTHGSGLALVVSPGTASTLTVTTTPSTSATAGAAFSTQPAVTIKDAYGNVETGDSSSTVTASVHTGTGPLTGTTTATASSGVATFSGLGAPTLAQTGLTLTYTDGTPTVNGATSITVSPDIANKLALGQVIVSPQTDGINFTPSPTVKVEDQYGNVVTSDSSTVVTANLNSTDGTGTLGGTVTSTDSSGVATFGALKFNLGNNTAAENIVVGYTAGSLTGVANSSVLINPNLSLSYSTAPVNTVAGSVIGGGGGVVVHVENATTFAAISGQSVTVSLASGTGTLLGTLSQTTDGSGNATFNDLVIKAAGAYTLKAAVGQSSVTSSSFNITVGSFSQVQVLVPGETAAPGTATGKTGTATGQHVGTGFNITVNAVDAYYNVVTTVSDSVAITLSNADTAPSAASLSSGTQTFSFTPALAASSLTITATDATASLSGTDTVKINHQNPYFRSQAAGNWSATSTWLQSTDDGATWVAATSTPTDANSDKIEVTNNPVTVQTAVQVNDVVIDAGAEVDVSGVALTISHDSGANAPAGGDCDVFGTLKVTTTASSSVAEAGTPTVKFESGSAFSMGIAGGAFPAATWNVASTCTYAPGTGGGSVNPTGLNQTFGNFIWNWAAQSASCTSLGVSGLTNIMGNLEVTSGSSLCWGTKSANDVGFTINIGGALKEHTGKILPNGGNGNTGTWKFNIGGGMYIDSTGNIDWGNAGTTNNPTSGTKYSCSVEYTGSGHYSDLGGIGNNANLTTNMIDAGVTLTVDTLLTNNSSCYFVLNGTMDDIGGFKNNAVTANMTVGPSGVYKYDHALFSVLSTPIPAATWDPNSTCEVIGPVYTNTAASSGFTGQSFGNFIWNPSSQTNNYSIGAGLTSCAGTLDIKNTGGYYVNLATSQSPIITLGAINLEGGTLVVNAGSGSTTTWVTNNVTIASGATLQVSTGTGAPVLNIGGNLANSGTLELAYYKTGTTLTSGVINKTTSGALDLGGTLIVATNSPASATLVKNDAFTLFANTSGGGYSTSGSFGSTTLPTLNAGLQWNNTLATDGKITAACDGSLSASAASSTTICNGSGYSLGGSASGGGSTYSYSWSPSTGLTSATVANPTASPSTTTVYTLTVTDTNNCTATASVTVSVNPRPTAAVTGSATICSGGSTVLSAALTGTGPWNVTWSDGTVHTGVSSSPDTLTVSPGSTTSYHVTALTDANCTAQSGDLTGSATVTINTVTANNVTYNHSPGAALKIHASDLLTHASSTQGTVSLSGVGTSANGYTVTYDANYLYYTNTAGVADSFTYTVTSSVSGCTATGTVTVGVVKGTGQTDASIRTDGGSGIVLTFYGYPGSSYTIQSSPDLSTWTDVATVTADSSTGIITYTDSIGSGNMAYYRLTTP